MSPRVQQHYEDKNDSQLSAETELMNSFSQHTAEDGGRPLRVSPFQVESILGIRNDKPIEFEENLGNVNSVDSQRRSTMLSPTEVVHDGPEPRHENSVSEENPNPDPPHPPQSKADSLRVPHSEDGCVLQEPSASPSLSPVDHNHPVSLTLAHMIAVLAILSACLLPV
jgi:hypothetical protein